MQSETPSDSDTYSKVVDSFAFGIIRFWSAEAASLRLVLALLAFRRGQELSNGTQPPMEPLQHLQKIPYSSYDALRYVTEIAHLVYATSLLDTFLSDTTLFLLLKFPRSIGRNQQIPLARLLDATSRCELVTESAQKKAREVSYLSFQARLDYLRDTFGLPLVLSAADVEALEHFPTVRNTAVHDQGVFDFTCDDAGRVASRQKTCPRHPTPLRDGLATEAAKAYADIATAVATAVFAHVLHTPDHPALRQLQTRRPETALPIPPAPDRPEA